MESRDKCLFLREHVPKSGDSLQKMEDWVLAVTMVMERAKVRSLEGVRRLDEYVKEGPSKVDA